MNLNCVCNWRYAIDVKAYIKISEVNSPPYHISPVSRKIDSFLCGSNTESKIFSTKQAIEISNNQMKIIEIYYGNTQDVKTD